MKVYSIVDITTNECGLVLNCSVTNFTDENELLYAFDKLLDKHGEKDEEGLVFGFGEDVDELMGHHLTTGEPFYYGSDQTCHSMCFLRSTTIQSN